MPYICKDKFRMVFNCKSLSLFFVPEIKKKIILSYCRNSDEIIFFCEKLLTNCSITAIILLCAGVAQQVEHFIGNEEVRQFESARQLHKDGLGIVLYLSHLFFYWEIQKKIFFCP